LSKAGKDFDLEERLIDFAALIVRIAEALPKSMSGSHIALQIIRSGTSPAANYGEARSAESKVDFVHKMRISLKELRETRVWLRLIVKAKLAKPELIEPVLNENEQLVSIFVASIKTAQLNRRLTS
jgi:four helix bundle protein